MFICLGRTLGRHKCLLSRGAYAQRFFGSLTCLGRNGLQRNLDENHPRGTVDSSKQVWQSRHFSTKELPLFYSRLFESVTTSEPSKWLKDFIIDMHDVTGLPWWATIILTSAAMKLTLGLPCAIYQQHLVSKLQLTRIELADMVKNLREETAIEAEKGRWSKQKAHMHFRRKLRREWKQLVTKNNCHPFKCVILSLSQLPGWLLLSLTLRKFTFEVTEGTSDSLVAALQFQVGGPFWCKDLTLPDNTLVLPIILTLVSLTAIELNLICGNNALSFLSRILTYAMRLLVLLGFIISMAVPSSVSLFWTSSAVLSLLQNLLLLSPRVRRLCRIPRTPSELEHPYSHFAYKVGEKCGRLGSLLFRK